MSASSASPTFITYGSTNSASSTTGPTLPASLPHGVEIRYEFFSPERAADLLERNRNPRKLRPGRVDQYGQDMAAGKWAPYTSSIVLDANGDLRDGQHRLDAAVKYDVGFWSLVVYGAGEEVIDNLDQGLKRTNSDVLRAHGESNHMGLAAAINFVRAWDADALLWPKRTTPTQARAYLEANPDLRAAVSSGSSLASPPLRARISSISSLIFRMRRVDEERANVFIDQLQHGTGLTEEDPAYRYRQWLLTKPANMYGRPTKEMELALGVKSWNAHILGKPLKVLRWARSSNRAEDFPLMLQADGTPYPFPEVLSRLAAAEAAKDADG